jgi:SAM-dependent methyltransferase
MGAPAEEHTDAGLVPYDLDGLADARRLGDWMFEQFGPLAGRAVVEVGPGVGTFTWRLLEAGVARLLLVESDPQLVAELRRRFGGDPRVTLVNEALPESPAMAEGAGSFEFVLCQNVLEHIEDDGAAVAAMAATLEPGGGLGILVPAHPRLYGALDRAFGHHRRYTRERLRRLVEQAGLEVQELYSFNLLGVFGWWAKKCQRSERLGPRSLRWYERAVALWRPVERRVRPPWGLSLIVLARRPEG